MIELRVSGAKSLIAKLKRHRADIEEKKKKFLEELAYIGIDTATAVFEDASTEYDGDFDVIVQQVPMWIDDNRLAVMASGKSILFVEFGTGLVGYGQDDYADSFGYGPGTWSDNPEKGGKGHWDDPAGWYYEHGKISHGNPPARAMYDSSKTMRGEIVRIAREVFRGDKY